MSYRRSESGSAGCSGGRCCGLGLSAIADLGICFAGLVLGNINPAMVQGAVIAGIPIAAGFDPQLLESLKRVTESGLNPARGY